MKTYGRLMKWAVELREFDITYQNKTALKSQVLVNFVVELTHEASLALDDEQPLEE